MNRLLLRGSVAWLALALVAGCATEPTELPEPITQPLPSTSSARPATWPDEVDVYFKADPRAVDLPTAALRTIRARSGGIERAELYMRWLAEGVGTAKRKPLYVRDNGDGTYTVVDGNSTTAVARKHGLTRLRAIVLEKGEEPPPEPSEEERLAPLRPKLQAEIDKGHLTGTVEEQIAIAKRLREAHKEQFVGTITELESLFPRAHVIGRIKTLESALGKLMRSEEMHTAEDLYDITGTRIITQTIPEVRRAVAVLKGRYEVKAERDYISEPKGNYRAHHLRLRWPDGLTKEVQVMTFNEHTFAHLAHDVYKPRTKAQSEALETSGSRIRQYYTKLANYFFAVDSGGSGGSGSGPPACPDVVQMLFACFVPAAH